MPKTPGAPNNKLLELLNWSTTAASTTSSDPNLNRPSQAAIDALFSVIHSPPPRLDELVEIAISRTQTQTNTGMQGNKHSETRPQSASETSNKLLSSESKHTYTHDLTTRLNALKNLEDEIDRDCTQAASLANMNLWPSIIALLEDDNEDIRAVTAGCINAAVCNYEPAQLELLKYSIPSTSLNLQSQTDAQAQTQTRVGLPKLLDLALTDSCANVRKRACTAISSAVRNAQPVLDALISLLPSEACTLLHDNLKPRSLSALPSTMVAAAKFASVAHSENSSTPKDIKSIAVESQSSSASSPISPRPRVDASDMEAVDKLVRILRSWPV